MGGPQSPVEATPPRAPQRGGPGAPMAHCSRKRLPPHPPRNFSGSLCLVNGTLECPTQEDPNHYRDLPEGLSKHLRGTLFPPWIIRHNSITAWEAHIVGAEWARDWDQ